MAKTKKKKAVVKKVVVPKVPKYAAEALTSFNAHLVELYPSFEPELWTVKLEQRDEEEWALVISPWFVLKYPKKWKGLNVERESS